MDDSHADEVPGARTSGSQQQQTWGRCKPPSRHLSSRAGVNSSSVYAVLIVAFGAFAYKDNRLGIRLTWPKVGENPVLRQSAFRSGTQAGPQLTSSYLVLQ